MNKIISYIKESYNELVHKVSWPTRQELSSSTIVVMTASLIMAVVVFAIDYVFEKGISFFYQFIFS
jgi:preprotein translocase subunit SecE